MLCKRELFKFVGVEMRTPLLFLTLSIFFSAVPALANWTTDPSVFVPTYYADHNDDIRKITGYDAAKLQAHWQRNGIREGRVSSPVLDVRYYLKHNPGVAEDVGKENYLEGALHWYQFGRREGRPSHPDFNVKTYLKLNKGVARELGEHNYIKAIEHYLKTGYKQGLRGK